MLKSFLSMNVLIIGNGISGQGANYALTEKGAKCFIFDDKVNNIIPKCKFDLIVVSPSICKSHAIYQYARENNIKLIGEIELGYLLNEKPIIAVTGTNGKTTTTELIGKILANGNIKPLVCGNIGKSFARAVLSDDYEIVDLEVSSFQLESIDKFKPNIACITNISADHLDRHSSMDEYINTKLMIAKNQTEDDMLILSQDDIPLKALENFMPLSQVFYISTRGVVKGAYQLKNKLYFFDEYICDCDRLKIHGQHNISNALMAICACKLAGVSTVAVVEALSTYESSNHRLRLVDTIKGVSYYNDSKGTNIGATIKAVLAMQADTCLILGGSDKGYEFDELFSNLPNTIKKVYAIGSTAKKIFAAAYRNRFYEVEIKESLRDAVIDASRINIQNVLLSPATASFDMFKNYEDRGEQFVKFVEELKEN